MSIWWSKDNPYYLQAEYRLNTLRADILRMKFELSTIQERLARTQSSLDSIDTALSYLRKYASVISMLEFQKILNQRAYEVQAALFDKKSIPVCETNIKIAEAEVAKLERDMPSLRCKVLEFKRA